MSERLQGVALGVAMSSIAYCLYSYLSVPSAAAAAAASKNKSTACITTTADDDCHSLFYGSSPASNGSGFPSTRSVDSRAIQVMKTVHKVYTRLPFDFYKQAVENLPIVCVDVICKRSDGKVLLFYRRDKPVAHLWWWPGGRLFRGGNKDATVVPVGVVQVWNTFFPDSHFDSEREPGKEGTQTVNITVVCKLLEGSDMELQQSGRDDWAVESSKWISVAEALEPNMYDKYVSLNVKLALEKGFVEL